MGHLCGGRMTYVSLLGKADWQNACLKSADFGITFLLVAFEINILCSIEVKLFLLLIFHCEVVTSHLNLVKLIWIYEHLSLGLTEKALYILSLVCQVLVFSSH